MNQRGNARILATALAVAAACGTQAARAGHTIDAQRDDWREARAYPADPRGDGGDVDVVDLTAAHDAANLYLRLRLAARTTPFGFRDNVYIDTDGRRETGYQGSGEQFSIGADYLVQGGKLFRFTGAYPSAFVFEEVAALAFDAGPGELDIEIALPLASLGAPRRLQLLVLGDNFSSTEPSDYYPDTAADGARGGSFRYELKQAASPGSPP